MKPEMNPRIIEPTKLRSSMSSDILSDVQGQFCALVLQTIYINY